MLRVRDGRFDKVFCVGLNKTGTTSMTEFFRALGYSVGDQRAGELLVEAWSVRNFEPIISLARTADFFQDIPFSCPYTYQTMDLAFRNAKFILTVRDDAEQWYNSLVRFHTKVVGWKRTPTAADLRDCLYCYKGWMYQTMTMIFNVSDNAPYERENLIRFYQRYNAGVMEYFRSRPNTLLVVNLAESNAAKRILDFLGADYDGQEIPHLNSSS